ncbi:putative leucine-rich repeat-containing protein DDB_G0290503 [Polyergus mexicanus]|uniref:putative leucine-rich repeat-containing protein DDB_G0290503 n=1 Tax=Polyergus mexicanus TaxID=615972 RepID=UPI0038B581B2
MTSNMCSSRKSHAVMNTDGYFHRPSPYAYQNDYYLRPRSAWSKVSIARANGNATWRFSSAMLIISSILVLIAVLAIAGLALWMGAFRINSKNVIAEFSCSFRIIRGEKYNPMLKLSTSMVFREKERKFKNIFELLFRRSVLGSAYKRTTIEKFENGGLKLFFRLYLDRKKIPRSIINIEDTIENIIVKETYSMSSLFKDMELDLTTVSVKRINKEESEKIGIVNQKQEQRKHAMITKNNLLRSNRNSSLITSSKPKTHTVRPTTVDSNEPDIDFNNIPTIKGTYRATKVNITAYNTTKGTSESIPDIKDTTRKMLSHEQITRSNKTSNFVKYSSTDKSSTAFTKSMTDMFNEEKLNEKREDEIKTSLRIATTQSNLDIFKDFHNPDMETSPWKPIVPYINTEFKLLSDGDIKETNRTESSTQKIVSLTNDLPNNIKQLDNKTSTTPSAILGLSESINFHDISTIGIDITGFPRDRIVPDLTTSKPDDNKKPDIEIAGQLPSETYNIRLKVSSEYNGNDKKASSTKISESLITRNVSENISIKDNALFQEKHIDSNSTGKTKEKFDNLVSMIKSDNNESHYSEKNSSESPTHGIGVAEPLSDTEVELEIKNQDSSILTLSENKKYTLRDRNVNVNLQQPVYTSYNTPNLNGDGFRSSLIENLATTKPFRYTIPVDKITPAVNYNDNISLHYSDDLLISNDEIVAGSNVSQDKIVTPLLPDLEEIIKVGTFVTEHDDTIDQLSNYEQIMSTEANIVQNNERDDELLYFNTTESYSDPIRKLVAENSGDKKTVSRNSTFIEIDIVEPDQTKENTESYANGAMANNNELKKVYNDTLKAYVVKSFVTLAPANKNTEIDKSMQLKLKIDSTAEETTPLELFGVRNYMRERDVMNTKSAVTERFSSQENQPDSMRSNEKESSRQKNTVIEQIVEIVTSISTRVSTNIKNNPIVSKFIATNSTNPIIRSEKISASNNEADKLFKITNNKTEKVFSLIQDRPSLSSKNLRTMQISDKKTSSKENQILLEKLKQLAEIRTDDDFMQIMRNSSNSNAMLQFQDFNTSSVNIDELKKIANVMTGNKTLKNVNLEFTLSRDGVEIFTKVLNKVKDQTDETLTTIRPNFSKTSPNNNYIRTRSNA